MKIRWLACAVVASILGTTTIVSAGPRKVVHPNVTVLSADAKWPGKIFVSTDEWVMGDVVFTNESAQFALNLASWFTGGRAGNFLVYSSNWGLTGTQLAETLRGAGHTWTVTTSVDFSLATLRQYDAVFLAGEAADNDVLIDFVRGGGNVYLAAGTGVGRAALESERWNRFLNTFGLTLAPEYYPLNRFVAIDSSSPVFKNVHSLWVHKGNPVSTIDPSSQDTQTLAVADGVGIFAAYETSSIPVAVDIKLGSCANHLDMRGRSVVHAAVLGEKDFDVKMIDRASLRVAGVPAFFTALADVARPVHPYIGRVNAAGCQSKPDKRSDLVLMVDGQLLAQAVQSLLGREPVDGEVVAVTITGTLDARYGGTPIIGEGLVTLRTK
jgi:hypothetical protein